MSVLVNFFDGEGRDVIARRDRVYTSEALAERETDPERKAELERMAAICARVPAQPAHQIVGERPAVARCQVGLHVARLERPVWLLGLDGDITIRGDASCFYSDAGIDLFFGLRQHDAAKRNGPARTETFHGLSQGQHIAAAAGRPVKGIVRTHRHEKVVAQQAEA